MSHPVSDSHQAIQQFHAWVAKNCHQGLLDPAQWDTNSNSQAAPFLPLSDLLEYLRSNNFRELRKLLRAALKREARNFDTIAQHCPMVFSILLLIGKSEYIERFAEQDHLHDLHLPFNSKVDNFPTCGNERDPDEFLRRFREKQWMICAPIIRYQVDRLLQDEHILPIRIKRELGRGESARICEVEIHPAYNELVSSNRGLETSSSNDQSTNTFVLKTYLESNAERVCERETSAFQRLQKRGSVPGMIGFYGSFKKQGGFNVLLEYADIGTLELYYKITIPPKTGEDIIDFWEQMFQLIGAVKYIHHEGQIDGNDGQPQALLGWHQDIKPDNILVSSLGGEIRSKFQYHMKMADLGTCHFKIPNSPTGEDTDLDSQGTSTYGAPECCRMDSFLRSGRISVTQKVDTWSLGAVFSEACVWVAGSISDLKKYRHARRNAPKYRGIQTTDCFHDGHRVLGLVHEWHQNLVLQPEDFITARVAVMVEAMLEEEKSRDTILNFWKLSQTILADARSDLVLAGNRQPLYPPRTPQNNPFVQSITSSPSSSATSHRRTTVDGTHGQFGEMDRVFSPGPMTGSYGPEQAEAQPNFGALGLQYPTSNSAGRHPIGNQHLPYRSETGPAAYNPRRSDIDSQIISGAQTYDYQQPQQQKSHNTTQDKDLYPLDHGNDSGQHSLGWGNTRVPTRNATNPLESGNEQQPTSRNLATSNGANSYPPNRPFSQHNHYRSQLSEGNIGDDHVRGSNQPNLWAQGNSSPHQADHHPTNYTSYPEGHRSANSNHWNGQENLPIRSQLASLPAHTHPQPLPNFQAYDPRSMDDNPHQSNSSIAPRGQDEPPHPEIQQSIPKPSIPSPPRVRKSKPPADLPIGTAIDLRAKKGKFEELDGYHLYGRLKERDHVFVVDDVQSMLTHWDYMEKVFGVLAYIIKPADSDGVDLRFTTSLEVINSMKHYGPFLSRNSSTKLVDAVHERRLKIKGTSNIEWTLDPILARYTQKLVEANTMKPGSMVRPLSIYVLTDGVWEEGEGCDPSAAIGRAVDRMVGLGYPASQIGIQFIVFGNSEKGWEKIRTLDDHLGLERDIVDATPSNGNMWKMLLGAIDKNFDNS